MSGTLKVTVDAAQLSRMAATFRAMGQDVSPAIARAINHTGDKAKTQMTRALTVQTGLKRKVIVAALKVTKASATKGSMAYTIRSSGGNISLRYFKPRETELGVMASPWGKPELFAHTFLRGGRFPNRKPLPDRMNHQVYKRSGDGRLPLVAAKSNLFIPVEMVKGASAAAFSAVVERDLPDRLTHELLRAVKG